MANLHVVLEECLARIARGEMTPEEALVSYPEHAKELKTMLAASQHLASLQNLKARPEFRQRARTRLTEHMHAHPRRVNGWYKTITFRYAAAVAILTLVFTSAGTALAQQALPGDALYSWKLTSERLWRSLQPNRVDADLFLADRRIHELDAIQGNAALEVIGVGAYAGLLDELRQDVNLDLDRVEGVNHILADQKEFLSDFFANSQVELPDPEELFKAIPVPTDVEGEPDSDALDEADEGVSVPLPAENDEAETDPIPTAQSLENVIDDLLNP
jgi:hypothetical protein